MRILKLESELEQIVVAIPVNRKVTVIERRHYSQVPIADVLLFHVNRIYDGVRNIREAVEMARPRKEGL